MARQILRRLTMLMAIVGIALAAAAVANGQAGTQIRASVPFDFIVTEKTLRAGDYDVGVGSSGAVAIQNASGDKVFRLSHARNRVDDGDMIAKLVFHRYGNTYFLSQVWLAGESTGQELPKSRQERAIARELQKIAAHRGESKPVYEVVEIAAVR